MVNNMEYKVAEACDYTVDMSDHQTMELVIPKKYVVDFTKVKTFEELTKILNITFSGLNLKVNDRLVGFEEIEQYLTEI
jgi:hypothetical protein